MATLADLTLASQQRCDRVNASTITPSEWTSMVNASVQELYGILTSTYEDYNIRQYLFTLVGGDPPLNTLLVGPGTPVPDFFQPRALWRSITASPNARWARIKRLASLIERNMFVGPTISMLYGQIPAAWNLIGNQLEILPPAASAGNYQLLYVPTMPKLIQQTDSIDAYWLTVNGWDEYVVLDVAAKALIKEESLDTADLCLQQKNEMRSRILREAAPRDTSEPGQIADVRSVNDAMGGGWGGSPGWGGTW